ncbi:MAG: HAD family hydrolase [Fibrobacterota bacterium]
MIIEEYTTFLWDFNGTVIDDVQLCYDIYLSQRTAFGLRYFTLEEYRDAFTFPVIDFYRHAGFNGTQEEYSRLAGAFIDLYIQNYRNCAVHRGVQEALSLIRRNGGTQIMISALEEHLLIESLNYFGLHSYFTAAYGLQDRCSGSKTARALSIAAAHGVDSETALYIGDTVHDYEVAQGLSLPILLISRGHNSRKRLKKDCPNAIIINSLEDII